MSPPAPIDAYMSDSSADTMLNSQNGHSGAPGIVAMEVYFPSQYVRQDKLEAFDGVGTGKYTIGLGQSKMAFVQDNEDIHSICLTAVSNLLQKHNISPSAIGRLEVGTETLLDKSKSVKTVLMQLFQKSGNTDIEGIDCTNACYGGTNAFLNTINWVESSSWDGRFGLVVAGDIAVYGTKAARPTGGAGVVAMLIGKNAALVPEAGLRASHMEHVYDFYKPDFSSEYPTVDGKLSNGCYMRAVDKCYTGFSQKFERLHGKKFTSADADFYAFHTPYIKLVQKSFGRLAFQDFLANPDSPAFADEVYQKYRNVKPEDTYNDAELEKVFRKKSEEAYVSKVEPATLIAKDIGNCYCASVWSSLLSLVSNVAPEKLVGKRVVLFSYGSGLSATMMSFTVTDAIFQLVAKNNVMDRLAQRTEVDVEQYVAAMEAREKVFNKKDYKPVASTEHLVPGAFYLTEVNSMYHRNYAVKQ